MNKETRWGLSWLLLVAALALHVADEALTGFLPMWNELAAQVRGNIEWLPLPIFTFGGWLGSLIAGILLLLAISPLFFQGRKGLRPLAYFFSILMVLNGAGHIAASLFWGRFAPGVISAPLLIALGFLLYFSTRAMARQTRP